MVRHHVKRHVNSYRYAAKGVSYTLHTQVNIWVQLSATLAVIILAYYLDFTLEQYLILILTIGFVLATELMNTALEEMTNLLSPEYREKAGVVKDVAAGAELVASVTAAIVGITLFSFAFWSKFGQSGFNLTDLIK
jgi:diacylglycerol kinase (ATP)